LYIPDVYGSILDGYVRLLVSLVFPARRVNKYHPFHFHSPITMPPSKLVLSDLNRLFEPSLAQPSAVQKPHNESNGYRTPPRRPSFSSPSFDSPASSTSTLALEDDEIKIIFTSLKYQAEPTPCTLSFPFLPQINTESNIWKHPSRGSLSFADELNADAAPFVPKSARRASISIFASSLEQQQQPLPPPPPIWLTFFEAGLDPLASTQDREQHAYALVISPSKPWDLSDFIELAHHFAWKGYHQLQEGQEPLAEFAFYVYTSFYTALGPENAQNFIWHLREKIVGQFLAAWDPDHPDAITLENSDKQVLARDFVLSSLSMAKLVGDLFVHNLVPRLHAASCLSVLFKNLCSVEHVVAICNLVMHAGVGLWDAREDIGQFKWAFGELAKGSLRSVLDDGSGSEMEGRVGEVLGVLGEWEMCFESVVEFGLYELGEEDALA
jgi:hypothetical protein